MMGYKKDFLFDSVIYGLGNGIKKFIGFFLLPFYTRALTPEDYGLLGTLTTFTMLLSAFLNFGLDSATGYYYFKAKGEEEKGKVLFAHLLLRLVGIIPPMILSFFSSSISLAFFKTEDYTWLVFISIMLEPVNLLMSEQSHIYRYFRKPMSYNITTIVKSVTNVGLGISLVVILKWGVLGAQMASILSSSVVIAGSFFFFTRNKYTWQFSWFWIKKMMRFGFPLIWAGLATWVFNSIDRFFLLHYKDLNEIGFYSVGTTFSQPILLINTAVQMSFGVLFFKLYNDEQDEEKPKAKKMAVESFNIYLYGSVLAAAFLSLFGVDLVNLLATKNYGPAALSIPFITFSAIAGQAYQLMGPGITLAEKNWHYTWITILTALINIGLNFLLIPRWGFIGAAGSTLISFIIFWLIKQLISHLYFKINYPYIRISIYYLIGLSVSLIIPFFEFYGQMEVSILLKVSMIILLGILPFALKLFPLKLLKSIYFKSKG